MPTPDRELARELLERHWSDVVQGRTACVVAESTAARIDAQIGSETVTFTYSLPTQLLGKLTGRGMASISATSSLFKEKPPSEIVSWLAWASTSISYSSATAEIGSSPENAPLSKRLLP